MEYSRLQSIKALFATSKTGNELILVPLASDIQRMTTLFTLNETGCFIWEELGKTSGLDEMANKVADRFDVSSELAKIDIERWIQVINATFFNSSKISKGVLYPKRFLGLLFNIFSTA